MRPRRALALLTIATALLTTGPVRRLRPGYSHPTLGTLRSDRSQMFVC